MNEINDLRTISVRSLIVIHYVSEMKRGMASYKPVLPKPQV
jgi:hypothetical protein